MADESDAGEKTEEPTQHRIDEFRKRGEVASSKELTSVLVLSGCLLTLALSLVFIYEEMITYIEWIYGLDVSTAFTEKSLKTIITKTMSTAIICAAPVCITALCVGVLSTIGQVGFLYSVDVLEWKPERLSPIKGVKKLFSMKSVVEAVKGFFKFTFIISIVYFFTKDDIASWGGYLHMTPLEGFMHSKWILVRLAFAMITGLSLIAIGDFIYQKASHKKKMMMTREELKKESKEQDGNPEVKQKIRQIQREMSQNRMLQDVQTADVIITNPTHISIAIKYDSMNMVSPTVIGLGADHIALKIREVAKEYNVPLVENVPLARTLYKTVKINEVVPRSLYKTVAEVLAFVYKLKRKNKAL